jgi:putative heme-binding domain-containing protein
MFHVIRSAARLGLGFLAVSLIVRSEDEFARDIRTTPPLSPAEERAKLHPLKDFEVQLVACEPDINKPMNMEFDALGRLWVTTSIEYPYPAKDRPGRDRLMIFEDFGPDGRARKVTEFAGGLNIPIGVYPFRSPGADGRETWKAVVWSIPDIWLLEDTDGDGKADKRTLLYGPFDVTRDTHGNQSSFRRGFDGWMYATHGYNNDSHVAGRDGAHADMNSGNVYRLKLDGSHIEHFTWGQVNPFGLAWDARGNLYSSDCHSMPVYQLMSHGYYPSFGKPHDGLGFAPMLMEHLHGSTAIDGMLFCNDDDWPAEFRDHTIIGNVMTCRLNHDRLDFHGSSPHATELPDFIVADDPWFRPVNDELGPDGAVYIADFYNRIIGHYEVPLSHPGRDHDRGRIWRVVYKGGGTPLLRPPALAEGRDGLISELGSPSLSRRMTAMNEIADRFGASAGDAVKGAFDKPANSYQRIHALWLLARLKIGGDEGVLSALNAADADKDALVRNHAQRVVKFLTDDAVLAAAKDETLLSRWHTVAARGLSDADPLVRRSAAQALGAWPVFDNVRPLLGAVAVADPVDTHLVYALRQSLRDQLASGPVMARVAAARWSDKEKLALADVAVGAPTTGAASFLVDQLNLIAAQKDPRPPVAEILAHTTRYAPVDSLGALAAFARKFAADKPGEQLALFQAIEGGLERRGLALPPPVRAWGEELVATVLNAPDPAAGWHNIPLASEPTDTPWDFQERASADGRRTVLISSHPRGEDLTGALRSPVFEAPAVLSFWLCGHDGFPDKPGRGTDFVALHLATDDSLIQKAAPPRNDTAQKITWDLSKVVGQKVYFEAVDGNTDAAYAWLAFGRFEPAIPFPSTGPRTAADRLSGVASTASRTGLKGTLSSLLRFAANTGVDLQARLACATAALALDAPATVKVVEPFLVDNSEPSVFRLRLGEAVARVNNSDAIAAVVNALKSAAYELQRRWIIALMDTKAGADAALDSVAKGLAAPRILQWTGARNHLRAANPPDWEARLDKLIAGLPPADDARDRLIAERRTSYKPDGSDAGAGKQVFVRNCAPCHQINGEGGLVGPQLTGIGGRGLDRLCEDVLDPNRNVDRAFRQVILTMADGDVVSGLPRREEGDLLVLANGAAKEFTVKKAEIKERRESEQSLMPENFGEIIPPADFNNLMAYLLAQRVAR